MVLGFAAFSLHTSFPCCFTRSKQAFNPQEFLFHLHAVLFYSCYKGSHIAVSVRLRSHWRNTTFSAKEKNVTLSLVKVTLSAPLPLKNNKNGPFPDFGLTF